MTVELKTGNKAPDFTLESVSGNKVTLSGLRGRKVVVYFYPKDMTPGCTQESCDFRDLKASFDRKKTVVLGISKDTVESHQKFQDKHQLNFDLLSDPDGKVCERYGVWREKSNYGRKYMGIVRSTFTIDPEGRLISVQYGVRVNGHAQNVLASL